MKRPPDIQINQFQLAILFDNEQKKEYKFMLDEGIYCGHCRGKAEKGIVVLEIHLTDLNDILVHGTCNVCNSKVSRIMEFGEDKEFYERATKFRKAIKK